MQEENEAQKGSETLESQIERLKKAIEDAKAICESLDTKMESARSYGSAVGKAIMLAMDRVDGFEAQLDGLKEFRFKAVLDSKDIEAIKAEQKTLKEDYEQHLNKHKETLNQLHESEKSILSNHRDELKEIMRGGRASGSPSRRGSGRLSFSNSCWLWLASWYILCEGEVLLSFL